MEAAASPKKPLRRWLRIGGMMLFCLAVVAYGITLPFLECGVIVSDCYFIPLGFYYFMLVPVGLHLGIMFYATAFKQDTEWFERAQWVHLAVLLSGASIYLIYHLFHPGWHETSSGFSETYQLLKPWHQSIGEELFFPFMFAASLLIFFNSKVKAWVKILMLLGLGILILIP